MHNWFCICFALSYFRKILLHGIYYVVIEHRLGHKTTILGNQFGFVPRRSTMEAIFFLLRHLMKNIEKPLKIYMWFPSLVSQFAQLLQKARKTTQSVKLSSNKRNAPQAMAVSTGERRRKTEGREYDTPPPLPCTPKELDVLLDKLIADGIFKPNQVSKEPTEEERRDPRFCRLYNYVQHPTAEC